MDKDYSFVEKKDFEEDEDAGLLMLQIANLWKSYHSKALKNYYDLTQIQYTVMASIYWFTLHNKVPVTQTMLAKHAKIDPMTLSHTFKGLEVKGYISRAIHPIDVRAKAVDLTQEGRALIIQAINTIREADRKFFRILGKDTIRFNNYLKKLLDPND